MAHQMEPMEIDNIVSDFDDKENTINHSNVLSRTPCTEKGYEELDVSELNMKLRYSITPASSPMSKSFTANCLDNKNYDSVHDVTMNESLTRSLNSTITRNDNVNNSLKSLPLQVLPTDQFVDGNRNASVLRPPLDSTLKDNNNVTVTITEPNDDENLSLPSSSSSIAHTPEATTPTKESPRNDGGSPILRGLKSVFNIFRPSQSPIPSTENENKTSKESLPNNVQLKIGEANESEQQKVLASTPVSAYRNKEVNSKRSSPQKESIVFNDDLEKELQWNDDSAIIFKHEKIPIHRLIFSHTKSLVESTGIKNANLPDKTDDVHDIAERLQTSVEYMDISYNDLVVKDKTVTDVNQSETNIIESDSEFLDCESNATKNESQLLDFTADIDIKKSENAMLQLSTRDNKLCNNSASDLPVFYTTKESLDTIKSVQDGDQSMKSDVLKNDELSIVLSENSKKIENTVTFNKNEDWNLELNEAEKPVHLEQNQECQYILEPQIIEQNIYQELCKGETNIKITESILNDSIPIEYKSCSLLIENESEETKCAAETKCVEDITATDFVDNDENKTTNPVMELNLNTNNIDNNQDVVHNISQRNLSICDSPAADIPLPDEDDIDKQATEATNKISISLCENNFEMNKDTSEQFTSNTMHLSIDTESTNKLNAYDVIHVNKPIAAMNICENIKNNENILANSDCNEAENSLDNIEKDLDLIEQILDVQNIELDSFKSEFRTNLEKMDSKVLSEEVNSSKVEDIQCQELNENIGQSTASCIVIDVEIKDTPKTQGFEQIIGMSAALINDVPVAISPPLYNTIQFSETTDEMKTESISMVLEANIVSITERTPKEEEPLKTLTNGQEVLVKNVDEEIIVSENSSPYVSVTGDIEKNDSIRSINKDETASNNVKDIRISPPRSPAIVSKGYNFNFDEIDDPFATKTKIRTSPPLGACNETFEEVDKAIPKKEINKNRRKSQPDRKRSNVIKKNFNKTFDGTLICKNQKSMVTSDTFKDVEITKETGVSGSNSKNNTINEVHSTFRRSENNQEHDDDEESQMENKTKNNHISIEFDQNSIAVQSNIQLINESIDKQKVIEELQMENEINNTYTDRECDQSLIDVQSNIQLTNESIDKQNVAPIEESQIENKIYNTHTDREFDQISIDVQSNIQLTNESIDKQNVAPIEESQVENKIDNTFICSEFNQNSIDVQSNIHLTNESIDERNVVPIEESQVENKTDNTHISREFDQNTIDVESNIQLTHESIDNAMKNVNKIKNKDPSESFHITENKCASSSEQSVYLSAGTSSSETMISRNVFNLPEIDDMNFNPFLTNTKIRLSPLPTVELEDPFATKHNIKLSPSSSFTVEKNISNIKNDNLTETAMNINNITSSSKNSDDKDNTVREIHTEDEDTVEGPFLDTDDFSILDKTNNFKNDKDSLMQFSNLPAQSSEDNLETGEIFIDAEAYEFLLNQNINSEVTDSGKESLFLKFDPLFAKRASSDGVLAALSQIHKKQSSTPKKITKTPQTILENKSPVPGPSNFNITHSGDINSTMDMSYDDLNVTVAKPMMVVNPAVNPIVVPRNKSITPTRSNRRSFTFTSPAMAAIDRLLSLSGNTSLLGDDTTALHLNREQHEAELALTQLRELLSEKEINVHHLKSENKELKDRLSNMETQLNTLETESQQRLKKVNELNEALTEKTKMNRSMAIVVEEYERTIASLITETEQERKQHAEERSNLIKERDEQAAHLANLEVSFGDLHSKYEKSKQVILSFKAHEDAYKKSIKDYEENLSKMQSNYELLKQHATSKLNHANQELEKINRAHEADMLKLNAMIKRKELHITSLEETLAQKTKANEELTAICDELINKVG